MTDLIEVRVSNLIGAALDWAVAMAEGYRPDSEQLEGDGLTVISPKGVFTSVSVRGAENGFGYRPSTDWCQGGPLVDKHHGGLHYEAHLADANFRYSSGPDRTGLWCYGPTALIAFCRGLVKAKLGDTVQVPKELCQ
ncbi:phage protein NinX family protein [Pseudomonas kurunegalensis]|uniref:phage protein NinX family protein n=1 Tax=Pseudomonas kurunegalensis TaxID=485880 RepID=UPI0025706BA4|nr:phage protein NinX family protein [Pseudomonas kurunegalensis]WJD60638.1 DUF2591 family protein [Pseudomonas kurunegalensis]